LFNYFVINSKGLTLHGTAGGGTVEWFLNPTSKVSAHYVVGQEGSVTQMVSEDDTAWHNGTVQFTREENLTNSFQIVISKVVL
jgi:N-acetyl-anhydromuramyl-L-alanine amidase AmpD